MNDHERDQDERIHPEVPGQQVSDEVVDDLRRLFEVEAGVGFSVVDRSGLVRFMNHRGAKMFLGMPAADAIGRTLDELFGHAWADERRSVFERIAETGVPVIMRHIRRGVRLQSTVRMIQDGDEPPAFVVLTVEGEHDLPDGAAVQIVESEYAHFGPLERLSKRELEVLALVGHGMTTAQIAAALHRSPRTVERHLDGVRAKLDATTRVQLAAFAQRAGLRLRDAQKKRV
jgi:DNA-binding CsgD family transcriptional regulator